MSRIAHDYTDEDDLEPIRGSGKRKNRGTNNRANKRNHVGSSMPKLKHELDRRAQSRDLHIQPKTKHQADFLDSLSLNTITIGTGSAGTGKAQPLTSKILTPTGWTTMGDIKIGDYVRSVNDWVEVLQVYPQGYKDCVTFTIDERDKVDSCLEHLWTVLVDGHEFTIPASEVMIHLDKGRSVCIPTPTPIDKVLIDKAYVSIEERLQYLVDLGLKEGKNYTKYSKQLLNTVKEVVLSLGGIITIIPTTTDYTFVSLKLPNGTQLYRRISSYSLIPNQQLCQCILVDHSSHLYVTDNYVLTHNTYLACNYAAKELLAGNIQKIVITRPYVAVSGRTTGFKPDSDLEKLRAFIQPMLNELYQVLTKNRVEQQLGLADQIELAPFESIRGRSFDNTIIIVDEASNTTIGEIQAITTRLGENCKLILIGDNAQTDTQHNGLKWFEDLVYKHEIPNVGVVRFNHDDIVRSEMVKALVIAFEREGGYAS